MFKMKKVCCFQLPSFTLIWGWLGSVFYGLLLLIGIITAAKVKDLSNGFINLSVLMLRKFFALSLLRKSKNFPHLQLLTYVSQFRPFLLLYPCLHLLDWSMLLLRKTTSSCYHGYSTNRCLLCFMGAL